MKVFLVGIPPSPQKVVQNLGGQWSRFAFLGSGTSQVIRISMSSWNHPQIRHHPPGIPLKCEFWYYLCFGKGVPGYPTSTVTTMAFTLLPTKIRSDLSVDSTVELEATFFLKGQPPLPETFHNPVPDSSHHL